MICSRRGSRSRSSTSSAVSRLRAVPYAQEALKIEPDLFVGHVLHRDGHWSRVTIFRGA